MRRSSSLRRLRLASSLLLVSLLLLFLTVQQASSWLLQGHTFRGVSVSSLQAIQEEYGAPSDNSINNLLEKDEKKKKHLVYLVEDELPIRTAVGQLLADNRITNQTYHIQTFDRADSCIQQLRKQTPASLPDALICDIRLTLSNSSLSGLQLVQVVRNHTQWQHLPVILLTAKGQVKDRIDGYQAGADVYLTKPFDPEELVIVLESLIEKHQTFHATVTEETTNREIAALQRDVQEIKQLLLEQGGGGAGVGGFVRNKDALDEQQVFLAPDERKILELLCEGLMNKEIADKLYLSKRRVEQLLTAMFRKIKVKNRTELVRWAITSGTVRL